MSADSSAWNVWPGCLKHQTSQVAGSHAFWRGRVYERSQLIQFAHFFILVSWQKLWWFVAIAISFAICVHYENVHSSSVDASFFKGMGMLLAVLLSLRVKNAVTRRQRVASVVLAMTAHARSLLYISSRGKDGFKIAKTLHVMLHYSFMEAADWLLLLGDNDGLRKGFFVNCAPVSPVCRSGQRDAILALPQEWRKECFLHAAKVGRNFAFTPRPLLQYLREACDSIFDYKNFAGDNSQVDGTSKIRRWHKLVDNDVDGVIKAFDKLTAFQEINGTRHFEPIILGLIFCYLALYPWCVSHESTFILGSTTLLMACVFYALDSAASTLEKSIGDGSFPSDIDLHSTFSCFFRATLDEIELSSKVDGFLKGREEMVSSRLHDEFVRRLDEDAWSDDDGDEEQTEETPLSGRVHSARGGILCCHAGHSKRSASHAESGEEQYHPLDVV